MRSLNFLLAAFGILLIGCGTRFHGTQPDVVGAVLSQGQRLNITGDPDVKSVVYVDATSRRIDYQGQPIVVSMISRPKPFRYPGQIGDGVRGIYNPGDSSDLGNDGGIRVLYQESIIHLQSDIELASLLRQGSAVYKRYFGSDGLMVEAAMQPNRGNALSINIWKVDVAGSAPSFPRPNACEVSPAAAGPDINSQVQQ